MKIISSTEPLPDSFWTPVAKELPDRDNDGWSDQIEEEFGQEMGFPEAPDDKFMRPGQKWLDSKGYTEDRQVVGETEREARTRYFREHLNFHGGIGGYRAAHPESVRERRKPPKRKGFWQTYKPTNWDWENLDDAVKGGVRIGAQTVGEVAGEVVGGAVEGVGEGLGVDIGKYAMYAAIGLVVVGGVVIVTRVIK